ncbi:hypothetical protein B0A50_05743 [Salinomyces thailandicus]|uniref:Flavoprotein domain-containing protein n=1 Tax=Salinomyces thailandicus TaxID=706561 RepID=A0A4U0TSI5_9PEZI|nr:hypothetical protein B0A50_05743 [Salinomyces thailandica]
MHLPATEKALDEVLSKAVPFTTFITFLLVAFGGLELAKRRYPELINPSRLIETFKDDEDDRMPDFRWSPWAGAQRRLPAILKASDHLNDGKHHLLLAATGSVATIKIPNIITALSNHPNLSIRLLLSESAVNFLKAQSPEQPALSQIAKMKNVDGIYLDQDEWRKPWIRGDSILHIELRRWADLMVIAPLSANSLAKVVQGFSDNLINSVVRAWDATGMIDQARPGVPLPYVEGKKKGIMVAPAMNTAMWHHPVTAEHMKRLSDDWSISNGGWFEVLSPIQKELACGDTGSGAMHDWKLVVAAIEDRLQLGRGQEKAGLE